MIDFETLYEMFFDIIENDKDFFSYNNVTSTAALEIAQKRARSYLISTLSDLSIRCPYEICGKEFDDFDNTNDIINEDLSNKELLLISNLMYEQYLLREFSKMKAQANRFTMKDLQVFSPANERNSFINLYNTIKQQNNDAIDNYLSLNSNKNGLLKLNYDDID